MIHGVDIMNSDVEKQQLYLEDTFDFAERKRTPQNTAEAIRKKNISTAVWVAIAAVSVAIVFQAYSIGKHFYSEYQSGKRTAQAQSIFDETIVRQTLATPKPVVQSLDIAETAKSGISKEIRPEILALRKELNNDDIIGYILIEDTTIRYPIVQAKDNEFYLTNDVFKNKNTSGAIFLDCESNREFIGQNSVLYGHGTHSNIMFHGLRLYMKEDYLKAHSEILVVTLYDETVWKVFSAYQAPASFNYAQTVFDDRSPFFPFLKKIYEKSFVAGGVLVDEDDIVLTLSTCEGTADDIRYVVHAKLTERKE